MSAALWRALLGESLTFDRTEIPVTADLVCISKKRSLYTSGNHTPSIKPVLPERVTLPSGNEIPSLADDWGRVAR